MPQERGLLGEASRHANVVGIHHGDEIIRPRQQVLQPEILGTGDAEILCRPDDLDAFARGADHIGDRDGAAIVDDEQIERLGVALEALDRLADGFLGVVRRHECTARLRDILTISLRVRGGTDRQTGPRTWRVTR